MAVRAPPVDVDSPRDSLRGGAVLSAVLAGVAMISLKLASQRMQEIPDAFLGSTIKRLLKWQVLKGETVIPRAWWYFRIVVQDFDEVQQKAKLVARKPSEPTAIGGIIDPKWMQP